MVSKEMMLQETVKKNVNLRKSMAIVNHPAKNHFTGMKH